MSWTKGSVVLSTVTLETADRFSRPRLRCSSCAIILVASKTPISSAQSPDRMRFQLEGASKASLYNIASLKSPRATRSFSITFRTSLTNVKIYTLGLRLDSSLRHPEFPRLRHGHKFLRLRTYVQASIC